jgi:glucan phosphoethanolaminetransferase (alkaline phosphatase superfamily)
MDLAMAVIVFPIFIALLSREIGRNVNCAEYFTSKKIGALFHVYSITVMCMMNFDRYMAIVHPITHRNEITKRRLLKYTVLALVLQTVLFAFSVFEVEAIPRVLAAITLLLIATTIFVYGRIFLFVRRTAGNGQRKAAKERKVAVSSLIIVVCFLLCVLPATIAYISRFEEQPTFSLVVRRRRFALLSLLSTTLNPVIFFWKDKAMRTKGIAFMKSHLFCRQV